MGLCGESQVSNDFPKIVDKIPDDRGWNRGKPGVNWNAGVFQRAARLLTFTKQGDVRGRRLALETTALMSPPIDRRHALKANLLTFVERLEFRGVPEL